MQMIKEQNKDEKKGDESSSLVMRGQGKRNSMSPGRNSMSFKRDPVFQGQIID